MKQFKISSLVFVCAVLILTSIPFTVSAAASGAVLSVSEAGGRKGTEVTVEVALNEASGIAGGHFNVRYDPEALSLINAVPGMAGGTINTHYAEDMIRMSFAGTSELKEAGSLLSLTFQIRDNALPGLLPVTLEKGKFYDCNAETVSVSCQDGGVDVLSAGVSLSSSDCLPGQSVKLDACLTGGLYPAGGTFDVVYNSRMLTAGSVKAMQKMGNVAVNLSYSMDLEKSVIHISWAAGEPVGELGRLCTVIFAVAENASGETTARIQNMKFYDENGERLDCAEPGDGVVTVVNHYKDQPTLYVVGGNLAEDGQTAVIGIAVDGAGVVCGGSFQLSYDENVCDLISVQPMMDCVAVNPENTGDAKGQLMVSWAEDSPALDNETILQLTCRMKGTVPSDLTLAQVKMKDDQGQTLEEIRIHSGQIGVSSDLQNPIVDLENKEDALAVQMTLYDAMYCGETPSKAARLIMSSYKDGQMMLCSILPDKISFDENGIAHVQLDVAPDATVDRLQLFLIDADGMMRPMCEQVSLDL